MTDTPTPTGFQDDEPIIEWDGVLVDEKHVARLLRDLAETRRFIARNQARAQHERDIITEWLTDRNGAAIEREARMVAAAEQWILAHRDTNEATVKFPSGTLATRPSTKLVVTDEKAAIAALPLILTAEQCDATITWPEPTINKTALKKLLDKPEGLGLQPSVNGELIAGIEINRTINPTITLNGQ